MLSINETSVKQLSYSWLDINIFRRKKKPGFKASLTSQLYNIFFLSYVLTEFGELTKKTSYVNVILIRMQQQTV